MSANPPGERESSPLPGVFGDCSVALIQSSALYPKLVDEVSSSLEKHGATVCQPKRDGSISLKNVTHIIANSIDFPQFVETQAMMIPVVKSDWVLASLSRGKQQSLRAFSPDPRMIFAKVVLTCADLPVMDKETIAGALTALGGTESDGLTRQTTHVCALSLEHPKCVSAEQHNANPKAKTKIKIVLPHWFDDCFKLGKRIDESPYLLPDPEILRKGPEELVDIPDSGYLKGALSATPTHLPTQIVEPSKRKPSTVFASKAVMLSSDLMLHDRLRRIIAEIITTGGGKVVDGVDKCDIFVGQFRDGDDYVRAARSCKDIGNLAWLYHMITWNEWTSPLRRLLHYPVPRDGIPGFADMRITLSNYGGEARIYLENLIKAAGAQFTKTMRNDNTHLITARNSGEKCQATEEWGITMANHLWLEESYAKCELLPMVPKYIHFPPRTNLGEIMGQTFFDEARLCEKYYPGKDDDDSLAPAAKKKRDILKKAQDNTYARGPAKGHLIHQDKDKDKETGKAAKSKKILTGAAAASGRVLATPSKVDRVDGKENETPSVVSTGSRSAKSKALTNLQKIVPDLALYEKERKRGGKNSNGPWGGKRAADQLDKESVAAARSSSPTHDNEEAEDDQRPTKKRRTSLPGEMRFVITGFSRWVDNKAKEDREKRKLRELGIRIVQETQPCDYLAAPKVVRTVKFLVALARGPTVVSCDFIDAVLKTGKVPPVEKYLLEDESAEEKFDFKLETTVSRAQKLKGKLLWMVPVYCVDNVRGGYDSYKAIAEANGAIFKAYRGRGAATIRPTTAEEDGDEPLEPVYLLSSNTAEQQNLWSKFEDMARKGNMEPRIVAPDWLLDVVLRQDLSFDERFLVTNFFQEK